MITLLTNRRLILPICYTIGFTNYRTRDDNGIIVEDRADVIQAFQSVGRLVVFEEIHDGQTRLFVPYTLVQNVVLSGLTQSKGDVVYLLFLVKGQHDILDKRGTTTRIERERHAESTLNDTIFRLQETDVLRVEHLSLTIFHQFGEHAPAYRCKEVASGVVVLLLHGCYHLLDSILIGIDIFLDRLGRSYRHLIGGERLALHHLHTSLTLLLLLIALQHDVGVSLRHGSTFHGIEHHLDFIVNLGLTGIFVLILHLHLRAIEARSQFQDTPAILGTIDSTPRLSVPELIIDTIDGFSLIGDGQTDIIAFAAVVDGLQLVEGIVNLLLTPVGADVLLAVLVGISHLIGILQRLQQRQGPVVVAQHIVYLTLLLCTHSGLNQVERLTLTRFEYLLNLRLLDPAHHIGIGLILQHLLLGVGQRGLRIGAYRL